MYDEPDNYIGQGPVDGRRQNSDGSLQRAYSLDLLREEILILFKGVEGCPDAEHVDADAEERLRARPTLPDDTPTQSVFNTSCCQTSRTVGPSLGVRSSCHAHRISMAALEIAALKNPYS